MYTKTIYDIMSEFIKLSIEAGKGSAIKDRSSTIIIVLGLWQVGFTGLVFILCIFLTHRVAGPLYKLESYLKKFTEGEPIEHLKFRKGDHFHEIAEEYNKAMGSLQTRYRNDFSYLSEVSSYVNNLSSVVPEDKKAVLEEIVSKLKDIETRYGDAPLRNNHHDQ